MELYINTIKNNCQEIEIKLVDNKKVKAQKLIKAHRQQAEKLLPGVEKLLKEKNLEIKKIKRIKVVNRGGSFTALRIGVITANALGFTSGVLVEGMTGDQMKLKKTLKKDRKFAIVKPIYDKEPNITIAQNK